MSLSIELEHSVNITASNNDPVIAGSLLMLKCTTMSNHVPDMLWIGSNGTAITENGSSVSEQVNGDLKSTTLMFDPLRTSHAGNYTCISNIEDNFSTIQAHHLVTVESKPQFVNVRLCIPKNAIINDVYMYMKTSSKLMNITLYCTFVSISVQFPHQK